MDHKKKEYIAYLFVALTAVAGSSCDQNHVGSCGMEPKNMVLLLD